MRPISLVLENKGFEDIARRGSGNGALLDGGIGGNGLVSLRGRYDEPDDVSDIYWIDSAVIDAVN